MSFSLRATGGLALLLATSSLSTLALAQEAPTAAEAQVEEIVITGQREALRAAIDVKRDAFVVADVVSADDIGKLPDHNTAAALRRIPGVSVMEDQGEPRFPTLRGLTSTYNRTTFDGATVASVDTAGRTVPLDIVPSIMAGRIEVVKTVTPDMDANAVGGVINVVTRSAFDRTDPFFSAMASYGRFEQSGDVRNDRASYRLSAAAGTRFGPDDQFGIVFGASHEQRDYDIPQVEAANPSIREYTAAGAPVDSGSPLGNGIQVPTQLRLFWYNNTKQRNGLNGKLEWRPGPEFRWEASALYSQMEDDEERTEYRGEPVGNVAAQTPTSGAFARGRNIIHINRPITTRTAALARTRFEWMPTTRATLVGGLNYAKSSVDEDNTSDEFRTTDNAAYAFTYNTADPFFPIFTPVNEAAYRNPANYNFNNHRIATSESVEEVVQGYADLELDTGLFDDGLKLKFGGLYRSTERDFDAQQATYTPRAGFVYTLDAVDEPGPTGLIAGRYRLDPRIGDRAAIAFFEANRASFSEALNNLANDFRVQEDVAAAYAQFTYERGPMTLIGGLRYERTKVDTASLRAVPGGFAPTASSSDYDNWLPGLHLKYDLSDRLIFRAAWTNTLGRADMDDLAAREAVSFSGSQAILSRGNPGLKPRTSQGFDASLEFYPRDGLIAVGAFHKRIKNEIFTLNAIERIDLGIGRGVENVEVQEPRNAQTAKISGLELAWQQSLTMLPAPFDDFGFNLNATLLTSDFKFVTATGASRETGFFQQPDVVTNASIFYQRGPFEARVSHNYLGGFLETVNAVPNADQYWRGRHVFDANVSYRINTHFTVFAEGENLGDSGRREDTGPGQRYLQEWADYGRTFWVGVQANF